MRNSSPQIAQILLEAGADPALSDKNGKTAPDLAPPPWQTAPVLKAWMAAHPPK